jgi:hypothetical protein
MTRHARTTVKLLALTAVALVLGLAGCGTDRSVAPPTQAMGIDGGQWAQATAAPGTNPSAKGTGNGNAWGAGERNRDFSVSIPIDGAVGGVVSLGRCTLTLPPGAFEGTQTITMECDDAGGLECRLYPEGLQFSQPVQLTMLLLGAPIDGPGATIYWWDPMAGSWVDMMGTYNPKGHTVTADLHHFSTYSPGKGGRAGW